MYKLLGFISCIVLLALFLTPRGVHAQTCPTLPTNTGTVTLNANIPTSGTYKIWSRIKPSATDVNANSYWLQFGTQCGMKIGDNTSAIPANTWTWVDFRDGTTTQKATVTLSAGNQVFKLIGNEASVGVDKILIVTGNDTCVPTGTGDNCNVVATATPTTSAASPTPTITPTPLPAGNNLLLNPSFESNNNGTPANWSGGVYDTSVKRTGLASNRVTGNGGDIYVYQQPTLKPSTTYTIQGYIKTVNVQSTEFGVSIRYGVTGGTASVNRTQVIKGTTDWTFVSKTFTTPSDYTAGRFDLHNVSTGTAYFDDVAICEGSCASDTPSPTTIVASPTPTRTPTPTLTPTRTPTPVVPTSTPVPTNTPVPNSTKLSLDILLHGIGKGGDNANPNSLGNNNPVHPQKTLTLELYDSSNTLVKTISGTVTFNSTNGNFTGVVDAGNSLSSGSYLVKVKGVPYLRRQVGGIITLTSGQTSSLPQTSLTVGDANNDNQLNILDYNLLLDCYSELSPARDCNPQKLLTTDFNDDGSVNQFDYNLFLRELSIQVGQ